MIEWIIGFLVAKWWTDKEEKKNAEESSENIYNIAFGYVHNGETI